MLFLGTGFSSGVPEGNCACEVCEKARDMSSPFFRTRSSVLIEHDGKNILIDAGTDFRFQTIKHNVRKIDAVLITHAHEDHIGGVPHVLRYVDGPVYGTPLTLALLEPKLEEHGVADGAGLRCGGRSVTINAKAITSRPAAISKAGV